MRSIGRVLVALLLLDGLSAVLRPLHDRWGTEPADLDRLLPGDEQIVHADAVITRAITIDAPAAAVWPWLMQLGVGRAGWYSIDLIDNLGRRSADHLLPQYQSLAVGETIPSGPFGIGFEVMALEAERFLLVRSPGLGARGTWLFYLDPLPGGRTRLIERLRARSEWWSPTRWLSGPADLLDLVMMRRHLAGIKARAERLYAEQRGGTPAS